MIEQSVLPQQSIRFRPEAGQKQLQGLVEQARRRPAAEQISQPADWLLGTGLDAEIQLGREAHGAQHAHRILAIARVRVADEPQAPRPDILDTADEIPNREILDAVIESVRREVAAPNILADRSIDVVAQDAALGIDGPVLRVELGGKFNLAVNAV